MPASPDPAQGSPPTLRGASSPPDTVRSLSEGASSPLSGNPDPAQGSPPTLRVASSPPDAVRLLSEGVSSPLSMDTASSAPGRGYVGNAAHQHNLSVGEKQCVLGGGSSAASLRSCQLAANSLGYQNRILFPFT